MFVKVRAPYESKPDAKPRRANFIGSTNKNEFLTDETGSVRFLCFDLVERIKFEYKTEMNINDVWRQAYSLYRSGFKYNLTPEELRENETANKKFHAQTSEMEMIQKKFVPAKKEDANSEFLTAGEILKEIFPENIYVSITPAAVGKALTYLGFIQDSQYDEKTKYSRKGYFVQKI